MGFLAPAVPWLIKGGVLVGSYLLSKKAENDAKKRSDEEKTALAGQQATAEQLAQTGIKLTNQSMALTRPAASYYNTLLGGNRAAMSQATAAPRAAITDTYKGAARNLEHGGIRGAVGDMAKANLNRERAGKVAGLTTGVQGAAAGSLADLGTNLLSQGSTNLAGGGSLYQNLLGQGANNRMYAAGVGLQTGQVFGNLLYDILLSGGKKSTTPAPTTPGGGTTTGPNPWTLQQQSQLNAMTKPQHF